MIYDDPDSWFNGTPKKTKKSKGAGGGYTPIFTRNHSNKTQGALKPVNAINAVKNNVPQVMVKISGASKGADKAQAHISYIGRHGEVELENQDGERFKGEEQKDLIKAWTAIGMPEHDKDGMRKEAFHIVFSMPSGTNPEAMKLAVKNLVNDEFAGHKYFIAQHLDTDSPHCHVLLLAADDRGARLNPRKADLHNYRVQFVNKLAEQGIQATATRRIHRFKYKDSKKQGMIHKEAREGVARQKAKPNYTQMKKIAQTHSNVKQHYQSYQQELPDDAVELKQSVKKMLDKLDQNKKEQER